MHLIVHACVDQVPSEVHRATLLLHCYYSASYLITLFCPAELLVPRTRTVIRQRRAFSVAGPTAWNGLPVALRLTSVTHSALFLSSLKTTLSDRGWAGSAPDYLEGALYKQLLLELEYLELPIRVTKNWNVWKGKSFCTLIRKDLTY